MARIRGRPRLEKLADHGYGMPEAQYARLMGEEQRLVVVRLTRSTKGRA